jgi:hypothetical protein
VTFADWTPDLVTNSTIDHSRRTGSIVLEAVVRRDSKPEIDVPRKASYAPTGTTDRATGWIVRLSVAGAEIESLQPAIVGDEILVYVELVAGEGHVALRGRVQWATATRFAVQFGALGARETSAVVRASRRPAA